jgi:hypothetical protein
LKVFVARRNSKDHQAPMKGKIVPPPKSKEKEELGEVCFSETIDRRRLNPL